MTFKPFTLATALLFAGSTVAAAQMQQNPQRSGNPSEGQGAIHSPASPNAGSESSSQQRSGNPSEGQGAVQSPASPKSGAESSSAGEQKAKKKSTTGMDKSGETTGTGSK